MGDDATFRLTDFKMPRYRGGWRRAASMMVKDPALFQPARGETMAAYQYIYVNERPRQGLSRRPQGCSTTSG